MYESQGLVLYVPPTDYSLDPYVADASYMPTLVDGSSMNSKHDSSPSNTTETTCFGKSTVTHNISTNLTHVCYITVSYTHLTLPTNREV